MAVSWAPIIVIELVLVFGTVVLWGWWELRELRRAKERREAGKALRRDGAS